MGGDELGHRSITLAAVERTAALIGQHVNRTPVVEWVEHDLDAPLLSDARVVVKLELFQRSGTFKARGALSNILRLTDQQRLAGVTAASAGNHAIAVAYAAKAAGTSAKLVMQQSANPLRVQRARDLGAEVLIAKDGPTAFAMVAEIAAEENRATIPPFDGVETALGTATLGLELHDQVGDLDVLFIAIGGGGLAGGVSAVTKIMNPACQIIGVEPEGADSMHRSFSSGRAENIGVPQTIADSLAPPMTLPIPYELCRENIDELMLISDEDMMDAMRLIFRELRLAVEPACAATTAALSKTGDRFAGKRVGLVFCGSNIDFETYARLLGYFREESLDR